MKTLIRFYLHCLFLQIEAMFAPSAFVLANFGPGTHEHGVVSKKADVATVIPAGQTIIDGGVGRFHIGAEGAGGATYVRDCTTALQPMYVQRDAATAADDIVACRVLGLGAGTEFAMADGVISFGQRLCVSPTHAGYVRALPATGGTYWVIGMALNEVATVQYDDFEFAPCTPYQVTVTS